MICNSTTQRWQHEHIGIELSFPDSSVGKEYTCNAGDTGLIPGLERFTGEGIGYPLQYSWASLVAHLVKESVCNAGHLGSIPGLGRSPGEGNGYPLQYSGLENSMDYSPWDCKGSDTTEGLSLHSTILLSIQIYSFFLAFTVHNVL